MNDSESDLVREQNAIFTAGQIMGLALKLDVQALRQYLDKSPRGFYYAEQCYATLEYRAAIDRALDRQ